MALAMFALAATSGAQGDTLSVLAPSDGSGSDSLSTRANSFLVLSATPAEGGTVGANPQGDIDETTYTNLSVVTLTATPASGFEFAFWGGDVNGTSSTSTQVTMDQNRVIQGNFRATSTSGGTAQYELDIVSVPASGGVVNQAPGPVVGNQYATGSSVTLTAVPSSGFSFREWAGTGITSANKNQNPLGVTVTDNMEIVASFRSNSGDDLYEPNNDPATAQPIFLPASGTASINNLVLAADGNEDWYAINVPALTHFRVDLVFAHNTGNLQLSLWDRRSVFQNLGFGQAVGESFTDTDNEAITYANVSAPKQLWLRVYRDGSAGNTPYSLLFSVIETDDAFDNTAPNNSPCQTVTSINPNQDYEDLVLRDEDWYRVALPNGTTTITVDVTHFYFSGDLNVMIIGDDPNDCSGAFGRILGGGFSVDAGAPAESVVNFNVAGRSSILLRVYGSTNFMRNLYDLRVSAQ